MTERESTISNLKFLLAHPLGNQEKVRVLDGLINLVNIQKNNFSIEDESAQNVCHSIIQDLTDAFL
jgi:hypothetical protein